ncbi:ABC transporter permease [Microbacterium sp. EYE_5]|uniref:ABC transporter permease n=1 Tax=unclassified Microbacterium TaxID=2609290 RepID=UPI0020062228|nr:MULTISPECIES: ABC transporter permease [unclassified Microbacterium]MCK6079328.1 ABC transporter permease [Microbacterium sp. EYE_382]MCK6084598.1 ABC transporter permease [Microbacterium sp. EYE_384]MCK6123173.1 ABC transporter permease [Microbacterium sp. EYE_80]MCK6125362.1 ABC transporter permease [Microbacterium sp. EYE_79]MCK6140282.1 ABC transporter permease [Microbacterium sp. EYE_39]
MTGTIFTPTRSRAPERLPQWTRRSLHEGALPPVVAFVAFIAIYLAINPGLLTRFQLQTAANLVVPLAVIALGQLLIVLIGGIDISIGAIASLCNVVFATQLANLPGWAALLVGIATGAACGLFNGFLVAFGRLPAIAVTLASAFIIGAIARTILDRPGGALDQSVFLITSGELIPFVPMSVVWLLLIAVAVWFVLQRTGFGRQIYGVGSNRDAVQAAGLNSRATILGTFVFSGILVSFGAMLLAGSTVTGDPRSGDPYLLTSIAAVALSGASFAGGRGSVLGTVVAACTLGLVGNLLFFAGVNSYWQYVVNALIIFAVVAIPVLVRVIAARSALSKGGRP